jgi:hypothetical protein
MQVRLRSSGARSSIRDDQGNANGDDQQYVRVCIFLQRKRKLSHERMPPHNQRKQTKKKRSCGMLMMESLFDYTAACSLSSIFTAFYGVTIAYSMWPPATLAKASLVWPLRALSYTPRRDPTQCNSRTIGPEPDERYPKAAQMADTT